MILTVTNLSRQKLSLTSLLGILGAGETLERELTIAELEAVRPILVTLSDGNLLSWSVAKSPMSAGDAAEGATINYVDTGGGGGGGPPSGPAGGSLAGTYPNPTIAAGAITSAEIAASLINPAAGIPGLRALGTTATTACAGNDARLTDARTPTGAAGGQLGGTYPNPIVSGITDFSSNTLTIGNISDGSALVRQGAFVVGVALSAGGTYTPIFSSFTNVNTASSINPFIYYRIGNVVHVFGHLELSMIADSNQALCNFTLPIATVTDTYNIAGVGTAYPGAINLTPAYIVGAGGLAGLIVQPTAGHLNFEVSIQLTYVIA